MRFRHRRQFLLRAAGGALWLTAGRLRAADADRVSPDDPAARSQGFVTDTATVDPSRYPRHTDAEHCGACKLFGGHPGEPFGPCSFYGGGLVPVGGWCRNFKARAVSVG